MGWVITEELLRGYREMAERLIFGNWSACRFALCFAPKIALISSPLHSKSDPIAARQRNDAMGQQRNSASLAESFRTCRGPFEQRVQRGAHRLAPLCQTV